MITEGDAREGSVPVDRHDWRWFARGLCLRDGLRDGNRDRPRAGEGVQARRMRLELVPKYKVAFKNSVEA